MLSTSELIREVCDCTKDDALENPGTQWRIEMERQGPSTETDRDGETKREIESTATHIIPIIKTTNSIRRLVTARWMCVVSTERRQQTNKSPLG